MSEEREAVARKDHPLERRTSKSRLSKQEEVEDEDHSPGSEASDTTLVPTDTPVVRTPGGSPESNSPEDQQLQSQQSVESDKSSPTQGNPKAKTLVRSKAVCDDTSPPPDDSSGSAQYAATTTTNSGSISPGTVTMATLSVSPTPHRRKLEKDGSQGSVSDTSNSPMLSRDSSMEYTDSTGTDLETFIKKTLNKNRTDRMTLLDLETKMSKFIKDSKQQYFKFPHMSSYHRMLVHRVAAFFGLDHNVDQSGKCVVVNRTGNTRLPDFNFSDHITDDMTDEQPQKQILQRDVRSSASFDDARSSERASMSGKKSQSLEERQYSYDKIKSKIFNGNSQEEAPRSGRGSQHKLRGQAKEDMPSLQDTGHKWSSADSGQSSGYGTDNSLKATSRITKASSFPGYAHCKADSHTSSSSASSNRLSKGDSTSSGTSGLSSPMARPATIPSSPPSEESSGSNQSAASPGIHIQAHSDGHSPLTISPSMFDEDGQPLFLWVASSVDKIPDGSLLINKRTQEPYVNKDGSLFRWGSGLPGQQGVGGQFPQGSRPRAQPPTNFTASYTDQPAPQPQMAPPIVNIPQQHSFESEGVPTHGSVVLTPQHSTESLPPDPPAAQTMYEAPAQPQPPPQGLYGSSEQAPNQVYGVPPSNQQQHMGQPPFLQPPHPQVPFNPSSSGGPIRIMYQPYTQSQGQQQLEGGGAGGSAQGQYGATGPSTYQSQLSHLTVQSVEYQQQQFPSQTAVLGAQGTFAGDLPQQYPASELGSSQGGYSGYTGAQGGVVDNPASYGQVQGFVPVNSNHGNSGPRLVAGAFVSGTPSQGHYQASQGPYRPKSPPTQGTTSSLSAGIPHNQPSLNTVGQHLGQHVPSVAAVNPQQYVSFSYTGAQGQASGPRVPQGNQPAPTPQAGCVTGPRVPPMWSPINAQAMGPGAATQVPVLRAPAVQIGDSRYIGQPLQVGTRPQIQPLFSAQRTRLPTPPGHTSGPRGAAIPNSNKSRKLGSKTGREQGSSSPLSTGESTESNEESLVSKPALEVCDLPATLRLDELERYLGELANGGASIQCQPLSQEAASAPTLASQFTILALYDSESSRNQALHTHKNSMYQLRPVSARGPDQVQDLDTITEQQTS